MYTILTDNIKLLAERKRPVAKSSRSFAQNKLYPEKVTPRLGAEFLIRDSRIENTAAPTALTQEAVRRSNFDLPGQWIRKSHLDFWFVIWYILWISWFMMGFLVFGSMNGKNKEYQKQHQNQSLVPQSEVFCYSSPQQTVFYSNSLAAKLNI